MDKHLSCIYYRKQYIKYGFLKYYIENNYDDIETWSNKGIPTVTDIYLNPISPEEK